jgi:hypothetical protein
MKFVKVLVIVEVSVSDAGKVESIFPPKIETCQRAYNNGACWTVEDECAPTQRSETIG